MESNVPFSIFQVHQPRGDYQEFLELAFIFLGGIPVKGISFKAPGAMHHARFMSKAIYCLKMFLFRKQLELETDVQKNLRKTCIFIVEFYIKYWFTAPSATKAANIDLSLMKGLFDYEKQDKGVSKIARSKLLKHLWYISEELIGLALFDESVTDEVKKKIVEAMPGRDSVTRYPKRFEADEKNNEQLLSKDLSDFASSKSLMLFEQFDLEHDFLKQDPSQ